MPFRTNVFINCPFDKDYAPLLRALVFTLQYLGFTPHLAQTRSSSVIRIEQIKTHINNCRFSVHDLSRSHPLNGSQLPRFHMPFELGLDIGASTYGEGRLRTKKTLILETERFHYQKVLSDIAGQDIEDHGDSTNVLVSKLRNWISSNSNRIIEHETEIWLALNQFDKSLNRLLPSTNSRKNLYDLPIGDYMKYVKKWLTKR